MLLPPWVRKSPGVPSTNHARVEQQVQWLDDGARRRGVHGEDLASRSPGPGRPPRAKPRGSPEPSVASALRCASRGEETADGRCALGRQGRRTRGGHLPGVNT
jgi:hypothetical protein